MIARKTIFLVASARNMNECREGGRKAERWQAAAGKVCKVRAHGARRSGDGAEGWSVGKAKHAQGLSEIEVGSVEVG